MEVCGRERIEVERERYGGEKTDGREERGRKRMEEREGCNSSSRG